MPYHFHKHYTRKQARSLLPQVRKWLGRLVELRQQIQAQEERLERLMEPGCDLGGPLVNAWARNLAELKGVLVEFYKREIQIKDLERGLIDFPALMDGREVFLCWEKSESDIQFWHDLESGYAGRERIEED